MNSNHHLKTSLNLSTVLKVWVPIFKITLTTVEADVTAWNHGTEGFGWCEITHAHSLETNETVIIYQFLPLYLLILHLRLTHIVTPFPLLFTWRQMSTQEEFESVNQPTITETSQRPKIKRPEKRNHKNKDLY